MGVIAHRVSRRYPPQKIAHRTITIGSQNQMPMIGHQLKRIQGNVIEFQALGENSLEGFVVRVFTKDRLPGITAIQSMESPPALSARGRLGIPKSTHQL